MKSSIWIILSHNSEWNVFSHPSEDLHKLMDSIISNYGNILYPSEFDDDETKDRRQFTHQLKNWEIDEWLLLTSYLIEIIRIVHQWLAIIECISESKENVVDDVGSHYLQSIHYLPNAYSIPPEGAISCQLSAYHSIHADIWYNLALLRSPSIIDWFSLNGPISTCSSIIFFPIPKSLRITSESLLPTLHASPVE